MQFREKQWRHRREQSCTDYFERLLTIYLVIGGGGWTMEIGGVLGGKLSKN